MAPARYFPGDYPALRAKLDRYLRGLADRLGQEPFAGQTAALLLAGGYGRGEGGVYLGHGEPELYNDLEFYLVLKRARGVAERARRWCGEEAHRGEEEIGIEVEFKILTLAELERAEPSMFYYDLFSAHLCAFGDAGLAGKLPAKLREAEKIPAHEAARLLFNRGTGLLFCQRALEERSERVDNGFLERNHAKARLAFADAVLALNGRYHFSAAERGRRVAGEKLAQTPRNWPQLAAWHREAVEFKFHPRHESPSATTLAARQKELVAAWHELFLWLESLRLTENFPDAASYARRRRLFPESSAFRNGLLHLRDRLRRGHRTALADCADYPRAALQKSLALLLEPGADAEGRQGAARLLALPENAGVERICARYEERWRNYN